MKQIDFKKTIYELTQDYPELISILKNLGFFGVAEPVMRKTVGRVTTLPEGCKKMGIGMDVVIKELEEKGFKIVVGDLENGSR